MKRESKGYRLYLQRLRFTGKKAIRTIKFPLVCTEGGHQPCVDMAEAVKSDYEALYGLLNVTSYSQNVDIYSLKDFWLDCLRAGAVICTKEAALLAFIRSLSGEASKLDEQAKKQMRRVNPNFLETIDFDLFKTEVIFSIGFRQKNRLTFFKDPDSPSVKKLEKEILSVTVNKPSTDQDNYWRKNYGVDKGLYETPDPKLQSPFFLLPDIPCDYDKKLSPIELIDRLETYLKDNLDSYTDKQIVDYLGIVNSASGLSATFGKVLTMLLNDNLSQIEVIFDNMSSGTWSNQSGELQKRLRFLARNVNKLGNPQLVNTWADYRTDFGGKVGSWLSNGLRQDKIISEHLFGKDDNTGKKSDRGHLGDLKDINQCLLHSKPPFDRNKHPDYIKILESDVSSMLTAVSQLKKDIVHQKVDIYALDDYRDLLASLRSGLNELYGKEYGDSGREKVSKAYPALHKELPKIPSFIGDVKLAQDGVYDKYLASVERVQVGVSFVQKLYDVVTVNEIAGLDDLGIEPTLRFLEGLLRLYRQTCKKETGKASVVGRQILSKALGLVVKDMSQLDGNRYNYIFRAPQAREKRGDRIDLRYLESEKTLAKQIPKLLKATEVQWAKYASPKHLDDWLVFIELEKMRLGLISRVYNLKSVYRDLDNQTMHNHFPRIVSVLRRFPEDRHTDSDVVNTVIQTAIFSELQGTVKKMTTNHFISRWVVQPIDSERKFPVVTDVKDYGQRRTKGDKYYIYAPDVHDPSDVGDKRVFVSKEIGAKVLKEKGVPLSRLIPLQSSKYQLQFLDNALFSKKWAKYQVKLASYSFIYEEIHKATWTDEGVSFALQENSQRLFVSIPFEIEAPKRRQELKDRVWTKFLGVDIGEYGLATYILEIDEGGFVAKEPDTRFVYDPALRKIRDSLQSNKERQRAGTFSIPNTYTKRLRDQAINSLRNRVHAMVVASGARPVYEWQVSAFESGSGKVSKIYHSLKRADTATSKIAADNLEKKLVWGTKYGTVGMDVDAYATSYSCSKCHQSIYAHIDERDDGHKAYPINKVITSSVDQKSAKHKMVVAIDVENTMPYGYLQSDKKYESGHQLEAKQVVEAVRKFSRPPLESLLDKNRAQPGDQSSRCDALKQLEATIKSQGGRESFISCVGSQAIFTCAFCGHMADADIQAAMWIALKGYLDTYKRSAKGSAQQHAPNKHVTNWLELSAESGSGIRKRKQKTLLACAKAAGVQPIGLSLDQRIKAD